MWGLNSFPEWFHDIWIHMVIPPNMSKRWYSSVREEGESTQSLDRSRHWKQMESSDSSCREERILKPNQVLMFHIFCKTLPNSDGFQPKNHPTLPRPLQCWAQWVILLSQIQGGFRCWISCNSEVPWHGFLSHLIPLSIGTRATIRVLLFGTRCFCLALGAQLLDCFAGTGWPVDSLGWTRHMNRMPLPCSHSVAQKAQAIR